MHFTLIESIYDNKILPKNRHTMSWERFVKLLSKPEKVLAKDSVPLISPVEYFSKEEDVDYTDAGEVRRCSDNVKMWHSIPGDFDGQTTIETAKERFKDYEFILYSTFSHQSIKKPFDCFRIFFQIKEPISNEEFLSRKNAIQKFMGNHDKSTLATSRGFYIYSCPLDSDHAVFFHNQGKPIDVISFEPTIEIPYLPDTNKEPPSAEFKAKVLEQLCNLKMVDYSDWWKIGSAMRESGYTLSDYEILSRHIRGHRLDTMKCKTQWNCSKRVHMPFGYLVNLCVQNFGSGCLKLNTEEPKMKRLKDPYGLLKNRKLTIE